MLLTVIDIALLLGFTLRLIRLVVIDDLGGWLIREPAQRWVMRRAEKSGRDWARTKAYKLVSGLDCPFCVGFWLAALTMASLLVAGGPGADGSLSMVWRVVAGVFTLNWVAAHVGSRLGDAGYADDED